MKSLSFWSDRRLSFANLSSPYMSLNRSFSSSYFSVTKL